jgi:hypothetical protein
MHMLQSMLQILLAWQRVNYALTAPSAGAEAATKTAGVVAAAAAAAAGAAAAADGAAAAGSSGSSGSSSQQVKWGYLLRLQQASPCWAAAVAAFDAKWPGWHDDAHNAIAGCAGPISAEAMQQTQQQYTETLELCRALAAAAPLPLLCNNPGCENLARVSEAAATSKRCTRCKCHYCSAVCQKANWEQHIIIIMLPNQAIASTPSAPRPWEQHKHACKRMAAAGQTCV